MKNIKLSKEQIEWIALGVLGAIGLIVIVSMLFVGPSIKQKKVLLKQFIEKKEKLRKDERIVKRREKLDKQVKKFKKDLKEFTDMLPQMSGSFSILTILNQTAQETGTAFNRIEPTEPLQSEMDKTPGFIKRDFLLQMHVKYHQIGAFLNLLENTSPFIQVQDVRIKSRADSSKRHEVKVVIRCLMEAQ